MNMDVVILCRQRRNELLRDIGNGAMNSSTMAALQKENGEPQFSL
jgi:hypothetical protein